MNRLCPQGSDLRPSKAGRGRVQVFVLLCVLCASVVNPSAVAVPAKVTVGSTLYDATSATMTCTLYISWPAFTSGDGYTIAAGSTTTAAKGVVSIGLVPTGGATPAGVSYTVEYRGTACSGNNFALGIAASGAASCAQPAFSNLSGSIASGQIPAATNAARGGVTMSTATSSVAVTADDVRMWTATGSDLSYTAGNLALGDVRTIIIGGNKMDADLTTGAKVGGGTATDNTTAINALLASGSTAQQVELLLNGATITQGVLLPSYGNVSISGRGWDDGFFIKAGSNSFGITNSRSAGPPWTPFDPGQNPYQGSAAGWSTPALTNTGGVILRDFFLNMNKGAVAGCTGNVDCTLSSSYSAGSEKGYATLGPPGTVNYGTGAFPATPTRGDYAKITNGSTATDCTVRGGVNTVFCYWNGSAWTPAETQWYTGIDISNLNYVEIENVRVLDSPTYGIRLTNVNDVRIRNVDLGQTAYPGNANHDGIHISGPATNVLVDGVTLNHTDDDGLAFNSPEGYSGAITNVYVSHLALNDAAIGVNMYGAVLYETVSEITGSVRSEVFRIFTLPGLTNGTFSISNAFATMSELGSHFGEVTGALPGGTLQHLSINNSGVIGPRGLHVGEITVSNSAVVEELDINNFTIEMTATGPYGNPVVAIDAASVGKLTFNGFKVQNPVGASNPIPTLVFLSNGGAINELVINSVDPNWITRGFTNTWTGISRVSGYGLLAAGFAVPDAIVVNGVPYVSATTGLPSIKLGGTANGIDGTTQAFFTKEFRDF